MRRQEGTIVQRWKIFLLWAALLFAAGAVVVCVGRRPMDSLRGEEIARVTVRLIPPSTQYTLTETEALEQVAALCRDVRIYRHASPTDMAGQFVEYSIEKKDGSRLTVQPFGTLLWINGTCYKTASAPSEALNLCANQLAG